MLCCWETSSRIASKWGHTKREIMSRPKLQPQDRYFGWLALELVNYVSERNAAGFNPKRSELIQAIPGLYGGNFEGVKSFWRKHFMATYGVNIMSKGTGRGSSGYVVSSTKEDNDGWVFIQRMPAVQPQINNMATASGLAIPKLKIAVASINGNRNRRAYRAAKEKLALAEAYHRNLSRLIEDAEAISIQYAEDVRV